MWHRVVGVSDAGAEDFTACLSKGGIASCLYRDVITTFPVMHILLQCLVCFYLCLSEIHIYFFSGGGGEKRPQA